MKKALLVMLVVFAFVAVMTGCDMIKGLAGHEHSGGTATCTDAAICDECGESYGDKLDHDYSDATCIAPKTCKDCGATDGETLAHSYSDATCTRPKMCKNCGATDGEPLSHNYSDATCTEPKTCEKCGATDGETLPHDYSDATCTKPQTCNECGYEYGKSLGHSYGKDYSYDESGHWHECLTCGEKKDQGAHKGGVASSMEKAVCTVCNQPYGEKLEINIDWEIEANTPTEGSTFCLANARIKTWYETFNYTTTDTDAHWLEEDIFLPDVPIFTWTVGDAALYYKVFLADNADFVSAKCYLTSSCELSVEHLCVGTTYYWYVDAVYDGYTVRSEVFSFNTQATPRTVKIDGVSNSRDIGGYITVDGMRIKQGMIYRSAKLDNITELGKYTLLYELGIKTDLDLRGDRNDYYKNATHPVTELEHIVVACPWYSTGSNHIWMDDYNKEEFAKAIKVFADPENYPIIFHCSLGRDRTGTLAMVLGGLLGLDENTLMMEYELSVFSYWGTNGSTKYNNGLRNSIHDTYLYIYDNYEGDSFSEKVESFLIEIGVTADEIASIKSIMLEEVV